MITIPRNESVFLRLPDNVRKEAELWAVILNRVHAAQNKAAEMLAIAREYGSGFSRKAQITRYYRARKVGWHATVNWAKVSGRVGLTALFIEHWIGLLETYQRDLSGKRAHGKLREQYRRWTAGDQSSAIPGYATCPPIFREGLPKGWSYRNLMHIAKARVSKAELVLARRGIAAARPHLPCVPQDVSQVRPLEYVVFDDVEIDFLISVPGSFTPVKLRLLVAMDLCSRVILGFGCRPAIVRPDGAEDSLKLRDMKCIVARTLSRWGYPLEYRMTLILERGTATLPAADISALSEISNGQIAVSETSMITGSVFEFRDRATGNSWGKAWLESFFNWMHNELGDREGQKGRRYDLAPAELDGRRKELSLLMRAGQRMPIALRAQLHVPFMSGEEALQELNAMFAKANGRTDHSLQGFSEIQEWRIDSAHPWAAKEEMPLLADRLGMDLATLATRAEWNPRPRMESPLERLQARLGQVERQEMSRAALHLLMSEHRRVKFADWQFAFDFQGREYVYLPPEPLIPFLEHEGNYLAWFDHTDLSVVYLTRDFPHRGWIGELKLFRRTRRGEIEEKKEALRQVKGALSRAAGLVASRHPERFEGAIARGTQNIELMRNVTALEVETDVAELPSAECRLPSAENEAVREMTARLGERAQEKADEKTSERIARSATRFGRAIQNLPEAPADTGAPAIETWDDVPHATPQPKENIETW